MHKLAAMAAAALLVFAAPAAAAPIVTIDQQATVGGFLLVPTAVGAGVGQSFTPTLDAVDAFEFRLRSADGPTSTVRVDLYAGAGNGGALLGSSAEVTVGSSLGTVHFDLAAALAPGQIYTVWVVWAADNPFAIEYGPDSNAGGVAYDQIGSAVPIADLVFMEGLHAATVTVPEPATLALLGAGLIGLGAARRRRRGAAKPA